VGEEARSILLGTAGLSVALLASLLLTFVRAPLTASRAERRAAGRVAAAALLVQCAHFGEELVTGFPQRFPEQLGLAPWSSSFFVSFNLFWLVVWALSCWGLAAGRRPALAALWFLGIAAVVNGIAHPVLSVLARGYFPGLITSPFLGVIGLVLVRHLASITRGPLAGATVLSKR
jgi:hypothetical protein